MFGWLSATDAARSTRCAHAIVTKSVGLVTLRARMGLAVQYTSRLVDSEANFGVWAVRNGLGLLWPLLSQLHVYARWCGMRLEHPVPLEHAPQGHGGVSDPQLTYLWDVGGLF